MRKSTTQNISVILNTSKPITKEVFSLVEKAAIRYGFKLFLRLADAKFIGKLEYGVAENKFMNKSDLILVIGGDGTFINAAHIFAKREVPLLGIHIGNLGFLTEFKVSEINDIFRNISANKFEIEDRLMVEAKVIRNKKVIKTVIGLNEIVVHKGDFTRLIKLQSYINKQYIGTFEGDGIIVATPTGSTGYSLSAYGPIIVPGMKSFIINTICPHTLAVRPIIVPSLSTIDIKFYSSNEDMILSTDGIKALNIKSDDTISITESKYTMKLIKSSKRNFFDILREKFEWVK